MKIPSASSVEAQYQIAIIRHGEAVDSFLDFVKTSVGVQMILTQSGLARFAGDPQ